MENGKKSRLWRFKNHDCRRRIHDIRAAAREGDLDRVQSAFSAVVAQREAPLAPSAAANARALSYAVRTPIFDKAGKKIIELETIAHTAFEALKDRISRNVVGLRDALVLGENCLLHWNASTCRAFARPNTAAKPRGIKRCQIIVADQALQCANITFANS